MDEEQQDKPSKPKPGFTEHGTRKVSVHLYPAELAILQAFKRDLPAGTSSTMSDLIRYVINWAAGQRRQQKKP